MPASTVLSALCGARPCPKNDVARYTCLGKHPVLADAVTWGQCGPFLSTAAVPGTRTGSLAEGRGRVQSFVYKLSPVATVPESGSSACNAQSPAALGTLHFLGALPGSLPVRLEVWQGKPSVLLTSGVWCPFTGKDGDSGASGDHSPCLPPGPSITSHTE